MADSSQTNFIGGCRCGDPQGGTKQQQSPIDGSPIGLLCWSSRQAAIDGIGAARAAQPRWCKVSVRGRARAMRRIGDAIPARREELAHLLTLEQGMCDLKTATFTVR